MFNRFWRFENGDRASVAVARKEFAEHLRRTAEPGSDRDAAVLIFSELLSNALTHGRGSVRASVGSGIRFATLWVEDAGTGFELERIAQPRPDQVGGRGLWIVLRLAPSVRVGHLPGDRFRVTAELPVRFSTVRKSRRQSTPHFA